MEQLQPLGICWADVLAHSYLPGDMGMLDLCREPLAPPSRLAVSAY